MIQSVFTKSKKEILLDWCKLKKLFNNVDVHQWGLDNFYICADRAVRLLVNEGELRRIPDEEAVLRGLVKKQNKRIAWYEMP